MDTLNRILLDYYNDGRDAYRSGIDVNKHPDIKYFDGIRQWKRGWYDEKNNLPTLYIKHSYIV